MEKGFYSTFSKQICELRNSTSEEKQFIRSELGTSQPPGVCSPGGCPALLADICLIPRNPRLCNKTFIFFKVRVLSSKQCTEFSMSAEHGGSTLLCCA